MADVKRSVRVAGRLREELAALLSREVHDPRVAGVAVADVRLTEDLQLAHVRVRLIDRGDDASARKALLAGLHSASGFLRREVGQRLGLRYAPRLMFHYDEGLEQHDRVGQLLDEIELEKRGRGGDGT